MCDTAGPVGADILARRITAVDTLTQWPQIKAPSYSILGRRLPHLDC